MGCFQGWTHSRWESSLDQMFGIMYLPATIPSMSSKTEVAGRARPPMLTVFLPDQPSDRSLFGQDKYSRERMKTDSRVCPQCLLGNALQSPVNYTVQDVDSYLVCHILLELITRAPIEDIYTHTHTHTLPGINQFS